MKQGETRQSTEIEVTTSKQGKSSQHDVSITAAIINANGSKIT